ncbi:hypothetical protein BsWGS_17831 [Bradybaena similaris]
MALNKNGDILGEDGKVFVLENVPLNYNEDMIIDYVESTLDVDVDQVKLYSFLQGRALVYLMDKLKDFSRAKAKIAKGHLESKQLKLLEASRETAVVVNSIDFQKLCQKFLCLYFESEFADGCDIIESCEAWSDLKMAVIHFHPLQEAVVKKILESKDLVPLPSEDYHISVHPCYTNFHEYIGQKIQTEVSNAINIVEEVKEEAEEEMEEDTEGEDDSDKDDVSDEEDTDKSDNNDIKNENKDDDNTSEIDSSEESSSDREATSIPRASAVRGGFRGRGAGAVRGGHAASSSRRKSNEEVRKDTVKSKSSSSNKASHKGKDTGSKYERTREKVGYTRGVGKTRGIQSHTLSTPSHDEGIFVEMKSQVSQISNMKSRGFRGRGGAIRHFNVSEFHSQLNVDAPVFNPGMSKQHSTSCTSLENFDEETSRFTAGRRPQEETLGAASFNQKLFENKQAFQKVEQESKNKLTSELEIRDAQIKQLQEELAKKAEQSKQCIEKIEMASWQKDFLPHCFGNFEGCRIYYEGNFAIVEGKPESVKEHQLKLLKELAKLKEQPLEITPTMHSILSKNDGHQYLLNLNTTHLNGVKVFLHDQSLLVVATSDLALKDAMGILTNKLNYKETISEAEIPTEKLQFQKMSLEFKFLVNISWDIKKKEIYVEGIKDDVFESIREIRTLMLEHMDQEKSFAVRGLHAKLLHNFYEDQIKQCLQTVQTVDYSSTEADIVIKFKGDRKVIQQVHRKLTELETKVIVKSWDVGSEFKKPEDLMLVAKGFESDKMKKKIHTFEVSNKCIVSHKLPRLEHFKVGTSKRAQPAHRSASKSRERPKVAVPVQTETKLKLKINDTCELVVKPYGDITKEGADVLVNVLTTHIDLRRTRVGQSFNKACPSLWKSLQAEKEARPSDAVLTTNGPFPHLKCQAICHIVLTPWDPNSSPAQLSTAIQLVITKAVALGAKSISFPVLGCGRALGFPPSDVADITLTCIKSYIGQAFQNVVLLAPDKELFKEFKSKVSKHFQLSPAKVAPVQVVGATSSPVHDVTAEDDEDDVSEESDDEEFVVEVLQQDVKNSYNPEISIMVLHGGAIENMWSDLKQTIRKVCLHTQYFNQDIVNYWPKDSRHRILQKAKKLCVWVERSPNPKTQKLGFIIKGEKEPVGKVYKIISEEFNDISSHLPKNRIKSSKAPKRGTSEFLKHAAESDEIFPSYWKLDGLNPDTNAGTGFLNKLKGAFSSHKPEKHLVNIDSEKNHLVNIDSKTKEAIKKLVKKTWEPNYVGHGNDAAGLSHSKIKVIDVKRIENKHLFELYSAQRKSLFRKMSLKQLICTDIKKIPGSKGRVVTTEYLEDFMKEELYYEVNEHYLFHGTKSWPAIVANGIDPRVSGEGGMFGKGIYTAEKFIKSDQYTDSRSHRAAPETTLYMILARVLLGNVFLCDHNHPSVASKQSIKLTRPPCVQCLKDICTCAKQELFDSVMGDGKWIFREFVVYDRFQCYPEYLISYQREA